MAKRTAHKQLTMDNYDQDDDDGYVEDDAGPRLATEDILKARPMAKARRRSDLNSPAADELKKSAFGGFGGFKGFGTNITQNPSFNAFKSMAQMETNDNPFKSSLPTTQTNGDKSVANTKTDVGVEDMTTEDSDELYNNKLNELNKCFFQHINSYMNRSESFGYDFTQVCNEYIEYHNKIETETKAEAVSGSKGQTITTVSQPSIISTSSSSFGSQQQQQQTLSQSSSVSSPLSLFSSQTSPKEEPSIFAKPTIQFGLNHKPSDTVSSTAATTAVGADDNQTEDSDEPPKVESIEHKEPDSVFTKRCKLFFKKGDDWSNKGFGYLYIKKEPSTSSPAQLLIRADNKLGVILLHISLNDSLPISKAPQNRGIYLCCIPNPPLDPKATTQTSVTFYIKVRAEETEQLFDTLIKYKTNQ